MRSVTFCPAVLLAAALALPLAAPARADIVVVIDKTTQRMAVSVDGTERYVWPVSTGRPGYDTPNGRYRPNRMDADHLSQEWDNAPMPHSIFFDLHGHAIHGFFDVKHLGLAVSHGCVRLSPEHASVLWDLVNAEGMKDTTVIVAGRTPARGSPEIAQRRMPAPAAVETSAAGPLRIAPGYDGRAAPQGAPYGMRGYYAQPQPVYAQPYYGRGLVPVQPPPPQGFFPFGSN